MTIENLEFENKLIPYNFIVIDEAQDLFDRGLDLFINKFSGFNGNGLLNGNSLILYDFIIYDSRVSVALAYIIQNSFTIEEVPDYLKLFIPPSYDQNNKRLVSPIFKSTNSNKKRHFFSNVISNLILKSVAAKINLGKQEPDKVTLRDIEAALFMIGYDIRN
jgi:hypothetical protein